MATFNITDRSGATYMVDAPDEYAALRTLGQFTPHVGPALAAPGATPTAAPAAPATSGNYWDSAPLANPAAPKGNYWDSAPLASDVAAGRAAPTPATEAPAPRAAPVLVPVDHDPFAVPTPQARAAPAPAGAFDDLLPPKTPPRAPILVPVDGDPFAAAAPQARASGAPLTFDDLIPANRAGRGVVNFDDLIPAAPAARYPDPIQDQIEADSAAAPGQLRNIGQGLHDAALNIVNGAALGFGDKIAAARDSAIDGSDYATNLAAQRANSQAAMDRQGIAGNAEQIAGMLAPAGLIGKGVAGIGALAEGVPLLGRLFGNPFVQAATTGAGVDAGDAAGNDTDLLRGALTGAAAGVVGNGVADAATIPLGALASRFNAAPVIPTAVDNEVAKQAAYKAADNAGVRISGDALDRLSADIKGGMAGMNYDPALHPQGAAVLNTLDRLPTAAQPFSVPHPLTPGAPPVLGASLSDLDSLRKVAGQMGANPASTAMGGQIKGQIDAFLNGLQPADILSGNAPAGIATLNAARRGASIAFKSDAVGSPASATGPATGALGTAIDNASMAHGNVYKSIGQQAKALKNSGQPWTSDESAALQSIIDGTPTQSALRFFGQLSPTSGGLMTGLEGVGTLGALDHAGLLGAASALAVPAIGYAAKTAADKSAVRGMTALGDLVRSGGDASAVAPPQNIVQQGARAANWPLSAGALNGILSLVAPGPAASVARAEPDSRAAALADTLTRARNGVAPSGVGAVFAR